MDKIAIISDIHGNLEALKSTLNDIRKRNINNIYCLGDIIAKGTNANECINLVKENCKVVLKGNCDEYFTSDFDLSSMSKKEQERMKWNKSKLSDENVKYLKSLPYCYEFYMSGRLVRLFHATPESLYHMVGNIDKLDEFYKLFLPSKNTISDEKADVVIYGHTHIQFVQKMYNRTIINTGSVGNAIDIFRNDKKDGNVKNTTVANYIILKGKYNSKNTDEMFSYELVNVCYNINKELKTNNDNIEKQSYEEEIRNGKYRDMEKIYKYYEKMGIDKNNV